MKPKCDECGGTLLDFAIVQGRLLCPRCIERLGIEEDGDVDDADIQAALDFGRTAEQHLR